VRRGADKRVDQEQLSLAAARRARGAAARRVGVRAASRPPQPARHPAAAQHRARRRHAVDDRRGAGGARIAAALPVARGLTVSGGAEWQAMRDARRNQRATGGRPSAPGDTLFLDQVERVTSLAPFAQATWTPDARWQLDAGVRHDRVRFAVADRFLGDRRDDSGARTLVATTGHAGASVVVAPWLTPYVNLATAFETPTTTELQARPDARADSTRRSGRSGRGAWRWAHAATPARCGGRPPPSTRAWTTPSCSGSRPVGGRSSATPGARGSTGWSSARRCARATR
jgi:outer membrane receptor protein involved in Fe transport